MSSKATILVVDDDVSVRDSLKRILGRQGYGVELAATAEEALIMLPEKSFDLVLVDYQMPGMDGLELLSEIKRRSPSTPVVMVTAHQAADTVIQALRRGANDYIVKPYKPDELLSITDRETSRHRQAALPAEAPAAPAVLGRQIAPDQLDEIDRILAELRAETAARCILMVEATGHVISAKGVIEDINVSALAALVAGDFSATAGIASLIGEGEAFRLNYHEGERYNAYISNLATDVFLLIIFGRDVKPGMVLYAAKRALPGLKDIVERAAAGPLPAAALAPFPPPAPGEAAPPGEPGELFSFDQIMGSGLLGEDALSALDEQFKSLWTRH